MELKEKGLNMKQTLGEIEQRQEKIDHMTKKFYEGFRKENNMEWRIHRNGKVELMNGEEVVMLAPKVLADRIADRISDKTWTMSDPGPISVNIEAQVYKLFKCRWMNEKDGYYSEDNVAFHSRKEAFDRSIELRKKCGNSDIISFYDILD